MKTFYLCGPINGRTNHDCINWRNYVSSIYSDVLDPMRRDYRGRELEPGIAAEIVAGDIEDIQKSALMFVYYDKPSVGTSMEVFFAKHVLSKPVVIVDSSDATLSPWLIHHADFVTRDIDFAIEKAKALVGA